MLSFGLALPTLIFFGQVSLVAIAANLIAVPVFSLFLLPVVLVGAALMLAGLWPADFVLDAGAQGLARLLEFLAILADLPGATRAPVSYGALTFVLAAFATLVVLLPRPLPGRVCALALLVAALHAGRFSAKPKLTVQVIDVGQGLSVLVQTENHNLLYDTGASWRDGDAGLSFILPALRFAGVRHLDTLVISHADTDHSGGAESIIQELPVARVLAADEHSQTYFDAQGCYAGMHWWWDSVEFRVLHPDPQHNWSENNGSCVLLVSSGASVLLLPGDIERAAELSLVGRHDLSSADLLLGPHHGSKTSSTDVFVEAATARHVVFSAGYANRWGFPRPEIMARWSAGGSCILLTSISGALRFVAAETGGFRLADARRSSLLRPWPIRNSESIRCVNTINGVDGGL
jgi:competence protein ComEC